MLKKTPELELPLRRHPRVQKHFTKPSLVKTDMQNECDINQIMKKFERNGLIEHLNEHQAQYGDFTNAPGYHDAMNIVIEADNMFASVPAKIRSQFNNDPAQFLEYVQDPKNKDDLEKMGLATAPLSVPDAPKASEPTPTPPEKTTPPTASKDPKTT